MMPARCKGVAFKCVDFPLTCEEIERRLLGRRVFTRTDYIVLRSGSDWAVVAVGKRRGLELLRPITSVEVLSLPDRTEFVNDPECDVQNPHMMARAAASSKKETVVVLGKFGHISFITGEKSPPVVKVVDYVPPHPSKTLALVEAALASGALETPVLIEPVLVDALALVSSAPGVEGSTVVLPCEAGRMTVAGREVRYLDKAPPLPDGSVILAGCRLTRKTFGLVYGREATFIDLCPRELARARARPGELALARCCDVSRVRVEGCLALVPYGATVGEVAEALRALLAPGREDRNALNQHRQ